jgi:prepilin-type N-terminal cleavage/methylation domain-containing protein
MKLSQKQKRQTGFTLIEVMVSVAIFVVISGAIFGLLGDSQKQFRTESQLLGAFQEARLGLDQIVRDSNDAGYPPQNHFSTLPTADKYTNSPVAWSPTYPATPCLIGTAGGGTCTTPGDFDVIFEGDVDGSGVKWIRYQLQRTTLYRGVTPKVAGADPVTATNAVGVMLPYVTNVMNNASATQIAQFQAAYPGMFPGGIAQPIFQFSCGDSGPVLCQNAGASNSPQNVRDIEITLIVMTTQPDAQTGKVRLVELNGRGRRINPNQ